MDKLMLHKDEGGPFGIGFTGAGFKLHQAALDKRKR
jgi:hypothetical protein